MKIILDEVKPGFAMSTIRSNFEKIEQFLDYWVIKREVDAFNEPNEMRTYLCLTQGGGPVEPPIGGVCVTAADIMLVIDNTGSQNGVEYDTLVKPALSGFVQDWIDLGHDMHVGISMLKVFPFLGHALTSDLSLITSYIDAIPTPSGNTNIADAILIAQQELDANGRVGVPGIIIIITDGQPNQATSYSNFQSAIWEAEQRAEQAKVAGYKIVVFGVMGVDEQYL